MNRTPQEQEKIDEAAGDIYDAITEDGALIHEALQSWVDDSPKNMDKYQERLQGGLNGTSSGIVHTIRQACMDIAYRQACEAFEAAKQAHEDEMAAQKLLERADDATPRK